MKSPYYGTRAQSQHLLDGDVPFLTGQLAIDISTKVISHLMHFRPTRHSQTVLPLPTITKKVTLKTIHASFGNTAIDNMTYNRVLNNSPPPINNQETFLSKRQRATLSQLRSGHCKILNSYKKRLKQTDSSSCPGCGMDPQDFLTCSIALLNPMICHDLWENPVKTIRQLSFLDPGNLD